MVDTLQGQAELDCFLAITGLVGTGRGCWSVPSFRLHLYSRHHFSQKLERRQQRHGGILSLKIIKLPARKEELYCVDYFYSLKLGSASSEEIFDNNVLLHI